MSTNELAAIDILTEIVESGLLEPSGMDTYGTRSDKARLCEQVTTLLADLKAELHRYESWLDETAWGLACYSEAVVSAGM